MNRLTLFCCFVFFYLGIRNLWPLQITSFTLNGNCPNSYNFPHALMPLLVQTRKLSNFQHTHQLANKKKNTERKMYTTRRWIDRAKLHLNTRMAFSPSSWFMVQDSFLFWIFIFHGHTLHYISHGVGGGGVTRDASSIRKRIKGEAIRFFNFCSNHFL